MCSSDLLSGLIGWVTWGLAHLAFMPEMENRLSLLLKWLWQIATRERDSLLIVGNHNQHMGVEVGLEQREGGDASTTTTFARPSNAAVTAPPGSATPPETAPTPPPAASEP